MDDDARKRLGFMLILIFAFAYTFLCYFLSRIFRKVPNLDWEPEWAFIPFINIYIITTKICNKSDVYFACMGVATMTTGILGVLCWMWVLFTFGQRFNHGKCWSFWLLFVFPFYGMVNIALDEDAYYRLDTPILEPPDAVFRRVDNPQYEAPDYFDEPGRLDQDDRRAHFQVLPGPGAASPDVQIVQRSMEESKEDSKEEREAISMSPTNTFLDIPQEDGVVVADSSETDSTSYAEDII